MTGVVLRCPTCGTTQNHSGECEACSEGEVRYFCTNHSPGRWLIETRCNDCGAKFGDPPVKSPEPTVRAAPTTPKRVGPRAEPRLGMPRDGEPSDPGRRRPRPKVADRADSPSIPSLAEVLVDMLEEGRRPGHTVEDLPWREPTAMAPRKPFAIMGCLSKLVLLVFLLIAFALAGLFSLFSVVVY